MRPMIICSVFVVSLMQAGLSSAQIESGLAIGDKVSAFQVVKQGGIDDGVEVGKKLCYR